MDELLEIIYKQLEKERNSPFLAELDFESYDMAKRIRPSQRPDGMSEALVDILLLRMHKVTALSKYMGKIPANREEYDEMIAVIKRSSPLAGDDI